MTQRLAKRPRLRLCVLLVSLSSLLLPLSAAAEAIRVRYAEGLTHGFLALHTLDGKAIADGDLMQVVHGDRVTCRVVFRFKDGSLHDDTTVFSQEGTFRMLSEHLIQKGPAFEHPIDVSIDGASGSITVRTEHDGKEKVDSEHFDLPQDTANGLIFILLKNLGSEAGQTKFPMVATTPKARLVNLAVTRAGQEPFSAGNAKHKATHFLVKVEVGGAAGLIAPLIGKKPPDIHVWILDGDAPVFVKSEGPLFYGGPIWRIELVSPVWH